MNGGPISWKDCWQDYALLSTSEAKFITVSQAGQEAHYLCETLTGDLWYQQMSTTEIFEDNLAYVVMSVNKNLVHRKFFTHIDIGTGRHLERELVKSTFANLTLCRTRKMVANAFTQSLASPAFVTHCHIMIGQTPCDLKFLHACRPFTTEILKS